MQIVVTTFLNREQYILRSFISDKFPRRRTLRLSHSRFVTKFSQWGRDISSSLEIICLAYLPELCSIWTDPTNLKCDNSYNLRWGEICVHKCWWEWNGIDYWVLVMIIAFDSSALYALWWKSMCGYSFCLLLVVVWKVKVKTTQWCFGHI